MGVNTARRNRPVSARNVDPGLLSRRKAKLTATLVLQGHLFEEEAPRSQNVTNASLDRLQQNQNQCNATIAKSGRSPQKWGCQSALLAATAPHPVQSGPQNVQIAASVPSPRGQGPPSVPFAQLTSIRWMLLPSRACRVLTRV